MFDTLPVAAKPFLRDYKRLREEAATISLDALSLIELSGEDRLEWLQGQATNDVSRLAEGNRLSFCLCEPTGQTLAVADAWGVEDRILMVVPKELGESVLERVERMTILEDVSARLLSAEYEGFSVQGPKASETLSQILEVPLSKGAMATTRSEELLTLVLRSDRLGLGGWDAWLPKNRPMVQARFVADIADHDAVEALRIEAGLPKWGVDMGPKTLPPELGPAFEARYVSYAKGCYTGQEVLMRMHSRGHTNKTWVGLIAPETLDVGDVIQLGERPVGTLSSASISPRFGWIGAATLRNEATAEGTRVMVGDVEAEVRPMPILRQD